jgi:hypothetical protein
MHSLGILNRFISLNLSLHRGGKTWQTPGQVSA